MAPPDREARRQMRQRGAGNHNLANANFGFTFGAPSAASAPLQPRASARRTPARLAQQPSSRRTPKPLAPRASARKTPVRSEKAGKTPAKTKTPSRLDTYFPQGTATRPNRSSSASAVAPRSAGQGSSGKLRAIRTPGRAGQQAVATPSVTGKRKRGGALDAVIEAQQEPDELGGGHEERRTPVRRRTGDGVARASTARRRAVQAKSDEQEDLDELGGGDEEHMLSSGRRGTEMRTGSALLRPLPPPQDEPDELESPVIVSRRSARESLALNTAAGEHTVENGPNASGVIDAGSIPKKRGRGRPRKAALAVEEAERLEAESKAISNGVVEDLSRISAETPARRTYRSEGRQEADAESADELTPAESRRKGMAVRGARKSQTPASMDHADAQSSDDLSPDKPVLRAGLRKSLQEHQLQHKSDREGESDDELSPERSERRAARRQPASKSSRDRAQDEETGLEHSPVEKDRLKATKRQSAEKSLFVGPKTSSDDVELETSPAPSQSRHDPFPPKPSDAASSTTTKPRKRHADSTSKPSQPAKRRKRSSGATVPITAYRLSKPSTLEPSTDYPTPRIPTLNAVDVLAQVTSEISARLSDNLALQSQRQPSTDPRARGLLRRKRATVRTFSAHLSDALFGLTEALDAGAALQSRLRAARKEKVALREELLDVRRRRQEVLVRMDEVRASHTAAQKEEREREALNEGLFDIEVAVQRGGRVLGRRAGGRRGWRRVLRGW
ncbi:hypothetical protein H2199_003909 [Coniosporium tulheliwenetii]|uniref:Uncharacterized protein n=1 Tax=Coniosporium tulheliwenetii TaxID=3383036 RepID=A0ACC2Z8Q9_9PEZI|nr:hypothetical protein H2199_003909 [Cladosporium sp. JES 115]